jgi:ParB family chromosome partitioning protein
MSNLLSPESAFPLAAISGLDPMNARGAPCDGVEALAALIRACGQLAPLILRGDPDDPSAFRVLVGGRRWMALRRIALEDGVALTIRARLFNGGDAEALQFSLAENVGREDLHPLVEAERFSQLANFLSVGQIAVDFGITKRRVRERLALGRLSPKVREAWRAGAIGLEQAKALCLAESEAQQEALLAEAAGRLLSPLDIRARLRGSAMPASAAAARYVGLEAYVAAGGEVMEDLFGDEPWLRDRALVQRLAEEKLAADGEAIRAAEGWGFCATEDRESRLVRAIEPDYLDAERAARDAAERDLGAAADEAAREIVLARLETIERVAHLRAASVDERRKLGVLVSIDAGGALAVERGLRLEPEAEPKPGNDNAARAAAAARRAHGAGASVAAFPPVIPAAARRIAEAAMTKAISEAVAGDDELAEIYDIAALALGRGPGPIGLTRHIGPHRVSDFTRAIGRARFEDALEMAAAASKAQRRECRADCTAGSIDLRGREPAANAAVIAMAARFKPDLERMAAEAFDYEAFFRNATRATALLAIREIGGEALERNRGWRPDDGLAEEAAMLARARHWLPDFLRVPRPAEAAE